MAKPKKKFGVFTLTMLVVGNAIGAGVYTTSGFALADLGSRNWVMAAWVVGGFIALCGAISYGMLARRLTESGGEYLYLSRSLHPAAGMIAGWVSLIAGFTGAIAFAATAFQAYAKSVHPVFEAMPAESLAIGSIIFSGLIHLARAQFGAAVHDLIVSIMIIALVGLCLFATWLFAGGSWQPSTADSYTAEFNLSVFAHSLVWISLSYSGFNAAVYVAGEAKDAVNAIPRAMIFGTILTIILYVALNAVFLYAPEPSAIAGQPEIASIAAEALGGSQLRVTIEFIICLSLLSSITAMLLAGPRVYAKMSQDGVFPRIFAADSGGIPRTSILLQMSLGCLLVLITDLQGLLSYLGFTLSLSLALAVSTLFIRHIRFGECPNSIFYPIAPIIFISATVLFSGLSAIREPVQLIAAAGTVLLGFGWYISRKTNFISRQKQM